MAVDDLDFARLAIFEHETYPKLVVDPDTMLTFSFTGQCLQTVPWRHIQLKKAIRAMQNAKLFQRRSMNIGGNSSALAGIPQ